MGALWFHSFNIPLTSYLHKFPNPLTYESKVSLEHLDGPQRFKTRTLYNGLKFN